MQQLGYDDFAQNWSGKPFILTDCIQRWPVCGDWNIQELNRGYSAVEFRAEAVDWPFSVYHEYMSNNEDESPLYLFDKGFAEKMNIQIGHVTDAAYWPPECFGPDLFELLGEERPAHRWLIIGPKRSGSTFHKDPNATSAWNAVLEGSKYWISTYTLRVVSNPFSCPYVGTRFYLFELVSETSLLCIYLLNLS